MQVLRSLAAALVTALLAAPAAAAAAAQDAERPARVSPALPPAAGAPPASADGAERLALHAFALHHRRAGDALEVVRPLLSPLGTVELQPGRNTVVVRDSLAALSRIVPELRRFDRPLEPLELEVLVVRALAAGAPVGEGAPAAAGPGSDHAVPAELERRLRALLRYERYELVAEASLRSRENEEVTYELGDGMSVRFRLGSLVEGRRIRLTDFQVEREAAGGARPLIHTNLNLWLDRPVTLGLARSETSASALMVAITCRRGGAKPDAAPARPARRAAAGAEPD